MTKALAGILAAAQGQRVLRGTAYDGVVDSYRRAGNFAGLANGKKGTFSFWTNTDYAHGFVQLTNSNGMVKSIGWINSAPAAGDAGFEFRAYADNGVTFLIRFENYALDLEAGDHHFIVSFDTGAGVCLAAVDGALIANSAGGIIVPDALVEYDNAGQNVAGWSVNAIVDEDMAPLAYGFGCGYESLFHNDFANIADPAVLAKFWTAGGPPFLGGRGQIPFGAVPVYYSKAANGSNLGTGGNLDQFGSPDPCTPTP